MEPGSRSLPVEKNRYTSALPTKRRAEELKIGCAAILLPGSSIGVLVIDPLGPKSKRQYLPSRSPMYAFLTIGTPLSPAALGSAWSAFFIVVPPTSPTSMHPRPEHEPPPGLPSSVPLSTLIK